MDILSILVVLGAFLLGIGVKVVFDVLAERKALSIIRSKSAIKGNEIQREQADRLMQFLIEVKTGFEKAKSEGKDLKAFAVSDLPAIGFRYPDVLAKQGGKLMKLLNNGEDTSGLAELLGGAEQ